MKTYNKKTFSLITQIFTGVFFLSLAGTASAGLVTESDLLYYKDTGKTTLDESAANTYMGFFAGATFPKIYSIGFRLNYISDSIAVGANNSSKFSGLEYGARVNLILGENRTWHLGASYYPFIKGSLTEGGTASGDLSGWGYQVDVGFAPKITQALYMGVKIVYRSAHFTNLVTPSNLSQNISYTDSTIFPVFFLSLRLDDRSS